ncbi:hypothetical protein WM00_10315 [Burkholderia cepacia]|nr:hypothetical protein WL58_17935 [Burkholderia cepacia]KWH57871.1 hypothetical protein WM00_10315 [Burkholderia cepacia]
MSERNALLVDDNFPPPHAVRTLNVTTGSLLAARPPGDTTAIAFDAKVGAPFDNHTTRKPLDDVGLRDLDLATSPFVSCLLAIQSSEFHSRELS